MKEAILLVNLGTPDAPTPTKVGKYLTQFLNDKRVIDINEGFEKFFLVLSLAVLFNITKFLEVTLGKDFIILPCNIYKIKQDIRIYVPRSMK